MPTKLLMSPYLIACVCSLSSSIATATPIPVAIDAETYHVIQSADGLCLMPNGNDVAILDRESKAIWALDISGGVIRIIAELTPPTIPSGVQANRIWSGDGRLFLDLTGEPYFLSIDVESRQVTDVLGFTRVVSMAAWRDGFIVIADLEQSRFALTNRELEITGTYGSRCPTEPREEILALACFSSVGRASDTNVLICDDLTGECAVMEASSRSERVFRAAESGWSMPAPEGANRITVQRRVMAVEGTPDGRMLVLCTATGIYGEPTLEVFGANGLISAIALDRDYQRIAVLDDQRVVLLEPGPGFQASLLDIGSFEDASTGGRR